VTFDLADNIRQSSGATTCLASFVVETAAQLARDLGDEYCSPRALGSMAGLLLGRAHALVDAGGDAKDVRILIDAGLALGRARR
jgi:hypothetical protein